MSRFATATSTRSTRAGSGSRVLLVAFLPAAVEIPALASAAVLAAALAALIVVETRSYGEARERVRHDLRREEGH